MVATPRRGRRDKHYWPSFFEQLARRMRDPRTDACKAWLTERWLLTRIDPITRPLLINQETDHPRAKRAGNDQSAEAMTATHSPVNYVRFPGEGDRFARPQNSKAFNPVAEAFLDARLGGHSQPVGEERMASRITVPTGTGGKRGLADALQSRRKKGREARAGSLPVRT